jgi:hypothetical protein
MQPISFFSKGWIAAQTKWTPQVCEAYAQRTAVIKVIPSTFPYARVVLLVDNKNLSADVASEDLRVRR